jgi:hypothetical protein
MPRHDARILSIAILRGIRSGLIVTALLSACVLLQAQVLQTDIVSAYRETDSAKAFSGLFQFGLSVEQQLNTVVDLGVGADFQFNAGGDALILGSKAKRSYAGDLRVTNSGYGHLRYRVDRRAPFGTDLFTQYQ